MYSVQAFGDIHGRETWKQYINVGFDYIVFIGDYFDNKDISGKKQLRNFLEILDWKMKYPDKVKLLLGNHDYHYLRGVDERYSGWEKAWWHEISAVINTHRDLLQPSFTLGSTVFSHAGVTRSFTDRLGLDEDNLDYSLQCLLNDQPSAYGLYGDSTDGSSVEQSPIWVRPAYLLMDKLSDYQFIVGHTKQKHITIQQGCAFIDIQGKPLEILDLDTFDWADDIG